MFSMAMWMAAFVAPIQIIAGDFHGLNTLEHQPAKIAAMEGHYETQRGAPLILFGLPDDEAEVTRYAVEIPKLGSLILTHSLDGEIRGLSDFPEDERPKAALVFWSFRVMVGLGMLMAALGFWSLWARHRKTLFNSRALHRFSLAMAPSGFIAILAGWITTEVGRQPWTVYGLLKTADSASPLAAPALTASLVGFFVVYFFVFGAGIYYILRLMRKPPDTAAADPRDDHEAPSHAGGITPAMQMHSKEKPDTKLPGES